MSKNIILSVIWIVKNGYIKQVETHLRNMIKYTEQEVGNLQYLVHYTDDKNTLFIYEVYETEEAFQKHINSDYFKREVLEGVIPFLEKDERKFLKIF